MEEFRQVALSDCYESPLNTRRHFDEAALRDLTDSVASKGVLTPILVRERVTDDGRFEILAGARRCRAARGANLEQVPARICSFNDDEALEVIVIENLQRQDVSALEEAEGYRALLERPGYDVAGLAAKVGKSEAYVYSRLKLCELIEPAKKALAAEEITPGHALLLARLQPADQKVALGQCFQTRWSGDKRIEIPVSLRELAGWIQQNLQLDLGHAPFDPTDAELVPHAGSCADCPKRSGYSPALFPDIAKKDVCTDRSCYQAKLAAHVTQTKARLEAEGQRVIELDSNWNNTKAKGAPLSSSLWSEVKRGQPKCEHVQKGIITAGHHDRGKVLTVCADPGCRVHHGYRSNASSPEDRAKRAKEQEKQRQAAEVRRRLFRAVLEAAPAKLTVDELRRVVRGYLAEMQFESVKILARELGLEPVKEKRYGDGSEYADWNKATHAHVDSLDAPGLTRLLFMLPLVNGLAGHGYLEERSKNVLREVAKDYVDVAAIEKALAAELKQRAASKAARTKRPAAKSASKKSAGTAAAKGKTRKAKATA